MEILKLLMVSLDLKFVLSVMANGNTDCDFPYLHEILVHFNDMFIFWLQTKTIIK